MSVDDEDSAPATTEARVRQLEERIDALEDKLEDEKRRTGMAIQALKNVLDLEGGGIRPVDVVKAADETDLATESHVTQEVGNQSRERTRFVRRLVAIEDELGVEPGDAALVEKDNDGETQPTRLGRLVKFGPEALTDNQSAVHYRAKALYENWNEWGEVRSDQLVKQRRLASKKHHLRTHLQSELNESLQWNQVYRAMEKVEELSDGVIELRQLDDDHGKHVLVQELGEVER